MKKLILTSVVSFATTLFAFAQNIAPAKAISFIKQPYSKAKASLIKEGYKFVEKDDEFYIFKRGKYKLTIGLKQNTVSALSVEESLIDLPGITNNLGKLGFILTKSSNGTSQLTPMSILSYEKECLYICSIAAAMNVNSSRIISLTYGLYSK